MQKRVFIAIAISDAIRALGNLVPAPIKFHPKCGYLLIRKCPPNVR
ncbi:MAG: hypothetical protein Q7J22_01585 [Candidatus Wolfebacteria bacterium]|nr:hypothetical protein [Candidatus Wolfebacteria bacterium]